MKKHSFLLGIVLLLLVLPFTLYSTSQSQRVNQYAQSSTTRPALAPTDIIPTFACIGGVPCTTPSVTTTAPSSQPSTAPVSQAPSTAPSASVDPCATGQTSITSNKGKKHKKYRRGGGSGGFLQQFIQFLIRLIEELFKRLGLPIGNPTPTPEPSITPVPSDDPQPSVTPCAGISESPTPTQEPTVTNMPSTQPTTAPTIVTTVAPTVAPTVGTAQLPAQVFSLANWKETLPTGSAGSPTEIKQPQLATFQLDPWFITAGGGIRFRAAVNGVTTSGSSYPRSELREMTDNGATNASWTTSSGTHTMILDEAITAVPATKKHVVAGQIHDSGDDVIVIRLESPKLFVDIGGSDGPTLDANYTLGKRFTVKFEVTGGKTNIYYNNSTTPIYSMTKSYSGAYFKTGAYTQSNCSTESASLCTASNYGEVIVYKATVTHQ